MQAVERIKKDKRTRGCIVIELAFRMPVRVLHSGMFATRRVYRPLWTLFAPTVVQLVVIGAGVMFYPTAAVVVARARACNMRCTGAGCT